MTEIESFVQNARSKGMSDKKIQNALLAEGWDEALVEASVLGLSVPKSPKASPVADTSHPSTSPLMTAMQHVLLWFFTASSTVTIASVVASLSGMNVSTEVLASMIAVTLITFTPYAILFLLFILKARRTPDLIPGKVWSIITICLHSIGAMAAGITLVVTLIVSGEFSVWLSALLILSLNLLVAITYGFAAFGIKLRKTRRLIVIAHLPALLLLFGTLFILSLLQLGPAKHDEELRKDLTVSAQNIRNYASMHKTLPTSGNNLVADPAITYKKESNTTYSLCATFQANNRNASPYYSARESSDAYVYESYFETPGSGKKCFTLVSSPLTEPSNSYYNY